MECTPSPDCKYWKRGCPKSSRHHLYWPEKDYNTRVERDFRALGENVVAMCREEHDILHATTRPPHKPSRQIMLQVINDARTGDA